MSWRDQLRPAKLGSASFLVDTADAEIGRNTQIHEYPQRDKPFAEDLGRKARRINLEAYVIGSDYMTARDALISVLESTGIKTLVHPYLGELQVAVTDARGPRESTNEGGMARFSLSMVESGEQTYPTATTDTQTTLVDKADASVRASADSFAGDFSTLQMPAFVRTSATTMVQSFATRLRDIVRTVTTVPETVSGFIRSLSDLSGAASQLILTPQTLASTIVSIFDQVSEIVAAPIDALDITRSMFEFGDDIPEPPNTTPSRVREAANIAAFRGLVQQAAVISAARFSSMIDFDRTTDVVRSAVVAQAPQPFASLDTVLALRDELVAAIDSKAEVATTDEVYYTLVDVRTAMVVDLQTRGAKLARIVGVTLPESTCAIALAYDLFEDVSFEADLIARNSVRDPNYVPSGQRLEVLSNA